MCKKASNNILIIFLKIVNFYIFSNLHVSFAVFGLVKITLLEIGISENKTAWFVFFSTLFSYNTIRFLRLNTSKNWYSDWITNNIKILYFISGIGFVGFVYYGFQLRLKAILILIPFAITTFFYVFPFDRMSLRNIPALKLFLIAFSWAGISVFFPLTQNYMNIHSTDWITFIQRFLFVIVITLPFDIRDVNYDSIKLKTLPQLLGIKKTKHIGFLFLFLFFSLEFFKLNLQTNAIINLIIISILSGILLYFTTKNQSKYYSAFLVESLPIVWWVLVYSSL